MARSRGYRGKNLAPQLRAAIAAIGADSMQLGRDLPPSNESSLDVMIEAILTEGDAS